MAEEKTFETPEIPAAKPSKNWPRVGLVILGGLALISASAYAGYWYANRQQAVSVPSEEKPSTFAPLTQPTEEDETADWKTYIDTVYNYSIEYPPDWFIKPTPQGRLGGTALIESYDSSTLTGKEVAGRVPPQEIKIGMGLLKDEKALDQSISDWARSQVFEGEKITLEAGLIVGGVTGVKQILQRGEDSDIVIYVPRGTDVFHFYAIPADSIHINTFDLMLSTFKFLD